MDVQKTPHAIPVKHKITVPSPLIKEKNTQAFTTISLTLIALSFFGYFAISPTITTIAQLQKQLADSKVVVKNLTEKINNLSLLQNKYSELADDVPSVLKVVPQNPTIPLFLGQIQAVALASNVTLSRLQSLEVELTKPKETGPGFSTFTFSLESEGSFADIQKFISSLISFERIISIDSLSLSRDQQQGQVFFHLSVKGDAYFKK